MSEASPEDVPEQAEAAPTLDVPFEADPADAVEQALVVEDDEDEHR